MADTLTVRFGHSSDPDDAFVYYPLESGRVDTAGLRFAQILEDTGTDSRWAPQLSSIRGLPA